MKTSHFILFLVGVGVGFATLGALKIDGNFAGLYIPAFIGTLIAVAFAMMNE